MADGVAPPPSEDPVDFSAMLPNVIAGRKTAGSLTGAQPCGHICVIKSG